MAAIDITPLTDHILVKRSEASDRSDGGLFLPETAKDKPQEGMVIAVGKGKIKDDGQRTTMQLKTGDRVVFTSYAPTEITRQGEDYLLMRESDVLAVIG